MDDAALAKRLQSTALDRIHSELRNEQMSAAGYHISNIVIQPRDSGFGLELGLLIAADTSEQRRYDDTCSPIIRRCLEAEGYTIKHYPEASRAYPSGSWLTYRIDRIG